MDDSFTMLEGIFPTVSALQSAAMFSTPPQFREKTITASAAYANQRYTRFARPANALQNINGRGKLGCNDPMEYSI